MKRSTRMDLAKNTVAIVERGTYRSVQGRNVDISESVRACLDATRLFSPDRLELLRQEFIARPLSKSITQIEVANETTLEGITRLLAVAKGPVAALNFASAKNPGGGFLKGSHAQEESLARSSALHKSLLRAWEFYEQHRAMDSLLYSDAMILSPDCPIFRKDDGELLDVPLCVTFITSAAPNAGAAANTRPEELPFIPDVFRRRSEYVLALAASQGIKHLVLGAWGCGVFCNDPKVVATAFMSHLRHESWAGRFEQVVFSVLDSTPSSENISAFQRAIS